MFATKTNAVVGLGGVRVYVSAISTAVKNESKIEKRQSTHLDLQLCAPHTLHYLLIYVTAICSCIQIRQSSTDLLASVPTENLCSSRSTFVGDVKYCYEYVAIFQEHLCQSPASAQRCVNFWADKTHIIYAMDALVFI